MKVVNYTELRLNLKHWLNSVIDNVEEVIIKRKGQKDVVLISLEEYNALIETNYLLSGKNREVLLKSIAEVRKGNKEHQELIDE
jgi:antitoxin YefM